MNNGNIDMSYTDDDLWKLLYLRQLEAADRHLNFMSYTWTNRTTPFLDGLHTRRICAYIDEAVEKFRRGVSTYWVIEVPFRHGKSEIVSRKLPAHFLGLFPDCKIILCGHTADWYNGKEKTAWETVSKTGWKRRG